MAWQDLFVGNQPGLSDQDRQQLAQSGLLQAGLQALALNNSRQETPGQALATGLLGGIQGAQQGGQQLVQQRFQQAQMQDQQDQMQRRRQIQDLALKFAKPDGTFDMPGYQQALAQVDPQAAMELHQNELKGQLMQAQAAKATSEARAKAIRQVPSGNNIVTQEQQDDGSWKVLATAPRWDPSAGAGTPTALERNVAFLRHNGFDLNSALSASGVPVPGAPGSGMAKDGSPVNGSEFLSQLPQNDASQVKALAEGRMAFPTGTALKSAYWQDMLQKVAQYDPSFDAVNYNARSGTRKAFTSGKEAQTVNALNTVAEHLGQLSDVAQSLNNTRFQPVNKLKNWVAEQTGDSDIARYQTTAKAAADEVAKVWRASGGSEADIQENLKNLSMAQSPDQLNAAIGTLTNLIGGKIAALQDQYAQGMGTTQQVKPLVSQGAANAFSKTLKRAGYADHVNQGAVTPQGVPMSGGQMSVNDALSKYGVR